MPKIIAVASQKGGGGKTTLTATLGAYATGLGRRVVLIDLDPQKSLTGWWNDREADSLELCDASADEIEAGKLRNLPVDLILIDTPPAHDSERQVLAALKAADLALIPVRPSRLDLEAVARTAALAESTGVPTQYVISQAVARSRLASQARSIISKYGPIAGTLHARTLFASAMTDGRTAPEIEPLSLASVEIFVLWRRIEEFFLNG